MTVTLSSAGGSSVPNWTLVASNAPSGVGTYTFPGLAGYSKYRILSTNLTLSSGAIIGLRLNGDAGANYTPILGTNGSANGTSVALTGTSATNPIYAEIDGALVLAPKLIATPSFGTPYPLQNSAYLTTSALTSITIFLSANNFSTGTIYLLGAN